MAEYDKKVGVISYKMYRKFATQILVSSDAPRSYSIYELPISLNLLLKLPNGKPILTGFLSQIKGNLQEGEKVLNTNIPEDILWAAGLNAGPYEKPKLKLSVPIKHNKRKSRIL